MSVTKDELEGFLRAIVAGDVVCLARADAEALQALIEPRSEVIGGDGGGAIRVDVCNVCGGRESYMNYTPDWHHRGCQAQRLDAALQEALDAARPTVPVRRFSK